MILVTRPTSSISDEEALGEDCAAIGGVIEGALEEAVGRVVPGDPGQSGQQAGQAVNVLGVNRVCA